MTYNSKIINEQGGSVLRVAAGGSLTFDAGGAISGSPNFATGAALTLQGGVLNLGSNQIIVAASTAAPSGLPVSGTAGDVFIRVDGANSKGYINTSDGAAGGSVWTVFSEL